MSDSASAAGTGTALITGASAGIGAVYARRLAERGHDLALVARRKDRLDQLAAELTRNHDVRVEPIVADLTAADDLDRVARRAAAHDVTLLVNNAGINGYGSLIDVDPEVLKQVVTLNVTVPMVLTRAALPGMLERRSGTVITVGSLLAFAGSEPPDPLPVRAVYAASKSFVVTFSRTLAAELAETPVRIQVVCPGYTATEFHMTAGAGPVEGTAPENQPNAMDAEDVVQASLNALERGEILCLPGLEDGDALLALRVVEERVMAGHRPQLATRYADATG